MVFVKGKQPPRMQKWCKNLSNSKTAEKNPQWKGDDVGLFALHAWVKRRFPKTKLCNDCKLVPPRDLANISQNYLRELSDWEWLCRRCHMRKDGRTKALVSYSVKRKHPQVACFTCKKMFSPKHISTKWCSRKCYDIKRK